MSKVVLSRSVVFDSAIQLTVAHQAPLSIGILQTRILALTSKHDYWKNHSFNYSFFFFPLHKMMEKKDVRSSSLRTPKLQLTAEQPSTGESWIPPKKETPRPRTKDKPQQDSESESRSVVSNSL